MNKQNLLSRAEMKKVLGGNTIPEMVEDDGVGGKGYKCCYTNPTGCSTCDSSATPETHTCPSGGTLTKCS